MSNIEEPSRLPPPPSDLVFHNPHHAFGEESFEDQMRGALKGAPWILLSLGIHLLAIWILMQFDFSQPLPSADVAIQASLENEDTEVLEPEEIPPPPEPPKEEIEEQTDDPIVSDDQAEVENTSDVETDSRSPVDAPFEGRGTNDVIGVGGGAGGFGGGKYGRRGGAKGGGRASQKAVELGLEWLKNHQNPEGYWDTDGFQAQCKTNQCDGKGHAMNDVGNTGLALLAFLGAGNTMTTGRYKNVVKNGLKYLQGVQDPDDGCIGAKAGQHFMYGHALATLALIEGYYLSRQPVLKAPAQKALDFISRSRNPYKAWRYAYPPDGDNDVSVTGWMLFALFAAKDAGLNTDDAAIKDGMAYLEEMTDPSNFRTGYHEKGSLSAREPEDMDKWPADQAEAMTAVAVMLRVFNKEEDTPALKGATNLIMAKLPKWDEGKGSIDYYYWYYGSYAMFQIGGKSWDNWSRSMEQTVVSHQRPSGDETGSWDPQVDPWGDNGGRVYATAINTLCLEVYYRYDKIMGAR
ncbi:MAG: terpene cyclase/mutase family protein [Planctomycetes bacterium]|nr:terpene cyclase/mutase family protein [Planctomycetota bacterium]